MYKCICKQKLMCVCISCLCKLKRMINAGREEKEKKGKKGKIVIKAFENMNRSFMITNFMIVGIWWNLFKNYFAGKPLREASQILGNLRLLGKSKQSYRAISSVLCFWRENRLWRRGLQISQVDFFPPSSVPLGTQVVWRQRCHRLSARGGSGGISPAMPTWPSLPPTESPGASSAEELCRAVQGCACPVLCRWDRSDLSCLFCHQRAQKLTAWAHLVLLRKPSKKPSTRFSPAARPGFCCPSFSFHLWLPLRCACSAVPT